MDSEGEKWERTEKVENRMTFLSGTVFFFFWSRMSQNCRLSRSDRGGLAWCRVPGHIPPLLGSVCIWCCLPAQVYNRQRWAIEIHSGSVPALSWKVIWAEGEDRHWPAGPSASSEPAIWAPPEWRRTYVTHSLTHTHLHRLHQIVSMDQMPQTPGHRVCGINRLLQTATPQALVSLPIVHCLNLKNATIYEYDLSTRKTWALPGMNSALLYWAAVFSETITELLNTIVLRLL